MNRTLLYALVVGGVLLVGLTAYWFVNKDAKEAVIHVSEKKVSPPMKKEEATRPVESQPTPQPSTTPTLMAPATTDIDEEDAPKPVSASRQQFESEEDTEDTDDSVTIEVEPEEE